MFQYWGVWCVTFRYSDLWMVMYVFFEDVLLCLKRGVTKGLSPFLVFQELGLFWDKKEISIRE